jgi:hypothetical protein
MAVETKGNISRIVSDEAFEHDSGHVAEKYRGSAADKRDMEIMGKQQVLRVSVLLRLKVVS